MKKNERLMLNFTAEGDPMAWTLSKIKYRLPIMLIKCEAEDVAKQIDQRDIDAALPKIVAWAETKTPQSSVTAACTAGSGLSWYC